MVAGGSLCSFQPHYLSDIHVAVIVLKMYVNKLSSTCIAPMDIKDTGCVVNSAHINISKFSNALSTA